MSTRYELFPLPSPHSSICPHFKEKEDGESETVFVKIVPVMFTRRDAFSWSIKWSCNFYKKCKNPRCCYSTASREEEP